MLSFLCAETAELPWKNDATLECRDVKLDHGMDMFLKKAHDREFDACEGK